MSLTIIYFFNGWCFKFDNIKHIDQSLILWRSSIQWIGGLYFLFSIIYLIDIYAEKPGNASEETFKEWSVRDSDAEEFKDGNPVEFKTLNLTKIMKILNSVANDEFQPTFVVIRNGKERIRWGH